MLKHGILGLLNYADATGYEIMIAFRDSLSHFWVAQTSQIYRELQTLEDKGWIRATHIEQKSKPDKNVFSITDDGKQELLRWLKADEVKKTVRSPMLMHTFFRGECSIDENIAYFKQLRERLNVFPNGESASSDAVKKYGNLVGDPMKMLYWKFTIDFGMMYDRLLLKWCEDCIKELEGIRDGN